MKKCFFSIKGFLNKIKNMFKKKKNKKKDNSIYPLF